MKTTMYKLFAGNLAVNFALALSLPQYIPPDQPMCHNMPDDKYSAMGCKTLKPTAEMEMCGPSIPPYYCFLQAFEKKKHDPHPEEGACSLIYLPWECSPGYLSLPTLAFPHLDKRWMGHESPWAKVSPQTDLLLYDEPPKKPEIHCKPIFNSTQQEERRNITLKVLAHLPRLSSVGADKCFDKYYVHLPVLPPHPKHLPEDLGKVDMVRVDNALELFPEGSHVIVMAPDGSLMKKGTVPLERSTKKDKTERKKFDKPADVNTTAIREFIGNRLPEGSEILTKNWRAYRINVPVPAGQINQTVLQELKDMVPSLKRVYVFGTPEKHVKRDGDGEDIDGALQHLPSGSGLVRGKDPSLYMYISPPDTNGFNTTAIGEAMKALPQGTNIVAMLHEDEEYYPGVDDFWFDADDDDSRIEIHGKGMNETAKVERWETT